jgi:outer membrane protein
MSHEGDGTVTATKVFGGVTYNASENVVSTIVLDSTDITAYYEILDNVVEVDLGLTARKIDGRIRIIGSTQTGEEKINDTIPMVYLAFGVNFPAGISLNGETNFMSAGGVTYSDLAVKLRYEFATVFGVEAGVRTQKLVLKNVDNVSADTTFGGPFIGGFVHF